MQVGDRRRPVQRTIDIPHANIVVDHDPYLGAGWQRAVAIAILRAGRMDGGNQLQIANGRRVLHPHVDLQRAQDVDNLANVLFVIERDQIGFIARWLGHQPDAKLSHDAKIRLRENAV